MGGGEGESGAVPSKFHFFVCEFKKSMFSTDKNYMMTNATMQTQT